MAEKLIPDKLSHYKYLLSQFKLFLPIPSREAENILENLQSIVALRKASGFWSSVFVPADSPWTTTTLSVLTVGIPTNCHTDFRSLVEMLCSACSSHDAHLN